MPRTTNKPSRARKPRSARQLAKELTAVKAEVAMLRGQWSRMHRTLLRLCCPQKWFEEEIDDEELWSKAVWDPPLRAVIDSLK